MPESASFNLIDQPWIPCLGLDARQPELFSLRGLLTQAHTLREIYADSPLVTAALYRLCLAVFHAALRGPKDRREWNALWTRRAEGFNLADKIGPYLDRWHSAFDLFGKTPFYQGGLAVNAESTEELGGNSAVFLMMGVDKNMATLFSHYTSQGQHTLTLARTAQELVAAQIFALGGGVSGEGQPNFTDAPGARGILFMVEGDTVRETLILNLVKYPPAPGEFKYQMEKGDRPRWEQNDAFDKEGQRPTGYLDYFTWPSRRILLSPPEIIQGEPRVVRVRFAHGLSLPKDDVRDPLKREQQKNNPKPNQSPYFPLAFEAGRALWRDSYTLFDRADPKVRRPFLFDWLALQTSLDTQHHYRLMAFGMAADQANIDFARVERLPLRLEFLTNDALVGKLSEATTDAENVGKALVRALKELAWGLVENHPLPKEWSAKVPTQATQQPNTKKPRGKKAAIAEGEDDKDYDFTDKEVKSRDALVNSWGADALYWSALETEFWKFTNELADAKDDPAKQITVSLGWRNTLREKAHGALEQAERYAGNSPRAFKAMTVAQWKLNAGLKRWIGAAPKRPVDESSATAEGETQ
jgi:CRISPR system Cascade subunit CasA